MRKWILIVLLLLGLTSLPIIALAQSDMPFDITDARLNGLTLPEGTRYVFILPYNSADAVYDLSVTVNLPLGVQLISAQQANGVIFSGVSQNATHTQLFWRANEILSGDLFAPFAFTLNTPVNDVVDVTITWADSLGEVRNEQLFLYPNTLNALEGGASFNAEAPIPAEQFTFIGDTGVVIYSAQELPAGAITVREAPSEENPPAELGDFWWCSGLDLQGASGVTVYVPLRKPLPPLMPLTLFASVNGIWQVLDVQGYVSADGLYAVYDHPGGLIFTGTEAENNPTEVPPAPPPPPDSDGDGFTDDVDACPNAGDAGFGLDGAGCPLPPPDSDGDGFPDPNDTCPTQGDAGFGLGGDGCPLQPPPPPPDSDGDGRPDDADSCPTEGDLGFGIDGDGCPNPPPLDTDGDGIPDFADTCPEQGDLGLGLNTDGCPILPPPDTDGDGIPDTNDTCPEQGDAGFGIAPDGCPLLPTITPTSEIPAPTDVPTLTPTATVPPQPTPAPVTLVRFNFTQFTTIFGTTAQAQVEIAEPSPADVRVLISPLAGANNVIFNSPSEVIIPTGQTSATFGVSAEVNTNGFINLVASLPDNPNSSIVANILVQPLALTGITVTEARLLPNQTTRATVSMSNPAEFDISIALTSTTPDVFVAPIVMPAGATSTTFDITASPTFSGGQAQISATFGDTAIFGGQSVTSQPIQLASALNYQIVLPQTISTPGDYTGEIVLIDPIVAIPTTFTLASSRPDVIVPTQTTLPAGADRIAFTISIV
ncbi:MAG: thrombospondin type 3 repeat-containing protein, partial [Anaerolineae bacterium]|nr:thrombospondin type 3 repeat-containing protein [Anaerolineae bacterium]